MKTTLRHISASLALILILSLWGCAGIGDRAPYEETEPHFHTFGDWSESIPATCTEPGTFERKCTSCGEVKTRHTPSLGHILEDWEKIGSTYVKNCTQCGEKVAVQEIFDTTADEVNYCLSPDRKSYIVLGVKSCKYGVIVIPNEVDGLKVVRVAENAFKNSKDIDTIILPDTLEEISANAFFGSSIRRIHIPDSVKTIGEYAFSECPNLEKLIFPNSLESIPGNLCAKSEGLTEVYIPGSVKEIGENAFTRCKQLKKVTLSEGLLSIANWAFSQCAALEEIRVPESATVLGEYIFSACGSLKRATLPSTITEIPVQTFSQTSLESFQIPTGVKKLDRGCFAGCTSLTEIDLPEGLTTLGSAVFSGCSSLKSLSIPEGILALDNFVLASCTSLESLHLPASLITINVTAFHGTGDSLTNITVAPGNSKYSSDGKTLYLYKKVLLGAADGSIPKDVTEIYACAFYGRTALTEIYIPKNIVKIEGSAFENCQSVTSITYEGTVAEWKEVELGMDWFVGSDIDVVHCSDGDTELVVERSPSMFD